ncbi:MAG: hypothetical protein HDS64_07410 [Bacteroidales bacterium]|nr:hypothetical protein [Bacteroidales bacterium]MBD5341916.1 hypothetical protein [Bacteroides sp.]MBD5360689.1 hypothetical protein [Bacteroides sp.]
MMQFKQSPVIFDEDSHSYHLNDKRLLGITGLIHSILGLGVYPEADDYVKDFIIPKAGSRGTAIHHAIQTYDQLGIRQTTQTVNTRQGDHYELMEWDVSQELDNYIRHLNGFQPLANELTVSDNEKYASQIDNVWLRTDTNGIWLVDTKSNNIDLYPLCGYFNPNYFHSGIQALQEYLSWQLSVYAELFEAENPGLKVEGLACNWLRKDKAAFWVIQRKPSKLVRELLKTEYVFTDNGPVYFHHDLSVFGIGSNLPEVKEERVIIPSDVVDYMAGLLRTVKEAESKLTEAKAALRAAMTQHGVKKYDFGPFTVSLSASSVSSKFNTKQFKEDHPEMYEKYVSKTTSQGSLTIKLKE